MFARVVGSNGPRRRSGAMLWLGVCAACGAARPAAAQPPVVVSAVVQRDVSTAHAAVGTVMPLRKSTVGSAVEGRIVEFKVNEGDFVRKGDVLAQVLTGTLEIQIAGAEAQLQLAREELREAQNGARPEEIAEVRARREALQIRSEYLLNRLKRMQSLFERKALSEDELDEVRTLAREADQRLQEARATTRLIEQGPRAEKIAQLQAKVKVQEEEVNFLKDRLEKYTIRAYFDGFVIAEHTEVGHWIKPGEPVVDVAQMDQVDVRVMVLEDYVERMALKQPVRVEIPALPRQVFTGEVAVIVSQGDARSRSFPVHIRLQNVIENNLPSIKSGMFARVLLPVGPPQPALLVPKDAVVLGGATPLVYVVHRDADKPMTGKVRPVPVELGIGTIGLIQVTGGLQPGQEVVVRGNERVRPDQVVTIAKVIPVDEPAAPTAAAKPSP